MGVTKREHKKEKGFKKIKHKSKEPPGDAETEITEKVLAELDGKKKDLELIQDVNDDGEVIECGTDLEAEPVNREELRAFIDQLGFKDIMETIQEDIEDDAVIAKKIEEGKEKQLEVQAVTKPKKGKKKANKFKDVQVREVSSTSESNELAFVDNYMPRNNLLLKPAPKWYTYGFNSDPVTPEVPPEDKMKRLIDYVTKLYDDEVSIYKRQQETSKVSDAVWIRTVLTSGTLKDKMAAWTLRLHEAPIHNLTYLDRLITMVNKKGRREALMAIDTLQELFMSELLPDEKKLKAFDQHPLVRVEKLASGNRDSRDKRLILWHFEDKLKQKYLEFIQGLETLCHDNVRAAKQKALRTVFNLLAGKPEQEKMLLSMLTNKLGDPDYKIASNAAHLLKNLVEQHPNMKHVIVADVERLVYRPNVSEKAQYYAVCFLNQILLNDSDSELALRLITIYFSFFKALIKKGEVDTKMLSALLTGVNRAYPFAKAKNVKIADHTDTLYKFIHLVSFNTSVQALMLLYQVTDSGDSTSDRFYQALYRKMLDPGLVTSSRQAMFLNLLYKSMKKDVIERRIKAFIKRLLQVCSCLLPPFICGSLILLSELVKAKPNLVQFLQMSQESDDEDEHFDDAPEEDEEGTSHERTDQNVKPVVGDPAAAITPSWIHKKNLQGISSTQSYNPYQRNPLYCHADSECVWELVRLAAHYHPTVALYAKSILNGEEITYKGDPLEDFTLIRFLDRFVYRNPKKNIKAEDVNKKVHSHLGSKSKNQPIAGAKAVPINSEEYLQIDSSKIPVDEQFFHRYFSKKAEKKKKKPSKEEEVDSDVGDDEFERYLDDYEKGFDGTDLKLDFAGEFSKHKLTKKATKKRQKDEEDDEEDDDLDMEDVDLSDEEVDFGSDDDMMAEFQNVASDLDESEKEDFNEEDVAFSDDDDIDSLSQTKHKKGRQSAYSDDESQPTRKKRKSPGLGSDNLFAAAEQFADIIDDNTSSKLSMTGSQALCNKDNADAHQLKWEMERARSMAGTDWRTRKRRKAFQRGDKQQRKTGSKFTARHKKSSAFVKHKGSQKVKH